MKVHIAASIAASLAVLSVMSGGTATAATGVPKLDINGDGRADLVMTSAQTSGPAGSQYQNFIRDGATGTFKVVPTAKPVTSVATCDFNGDGRTDVAFGQPFLDPNYAGGILVGYGSSTGLVRLLTITQNSPGVPGTSAPGDQFGQSLACGRIGSDKYADLVIGAPSERVGAANEAGSITILKGSSTGLTGSGSQVITQNTAGVVDTAEAGDSFGWTIAVGDVTGDGASEIIVTAPEENRYGIVHFLRGTTTGWTGTGSTSYLSSSTAACRRLGIEDIAMGRFDGAGALDVAITCQNAAGAAGGAVGIFKASSTNITRPSMVLSQSTSGVPETDASNDYWGHSVSTGDVNRDGRDDLLVGNPWEISNGMENGTVTLIAGSSTGLTGTGATSLNQDSTGVPGTSEYGDYFGAEVALSDTNGDGFSDPVIGAWYEDNGAGAVTMLRGASTGISTSGSRAYGPADIASTTIAKWLGWRLAG